MRRLILFVCIVVAVLPATAAKRLTVAQLEQSLSAGIAAHHSDAEVARNVGGFELTERLTGRTLDRFAARMPLGPRTALALELLADESAFLDPPPGELPATEPPDAAAQQHMLDMARGYVVETWPKLPNFFVARTTHRFDDSPQILKQGDWPVRLGLHLVGTTNRQVTFRDGKEVLDAPAAVPSAASGAPAAVPSAPPAMAVEVGLHTWGEFGPELMVVLTDAAKGKVTFAHWEQTPAGLAAVYRYAVPRAASHYAVNYCCVQNAEFVERRDLTYRSRGQTPQQMANLPQTTASQSFEDTPGYHGSLFINPATGAILRVTLEAELKPGDPITRASSAVEYGPVKIGEQSYICPLRSLAISSEPPTYKANGEPSNPSVLLVNETSFTEYHRFGATMRVLADAADGNPQPAPQGQNAASGSALAASTSGDSPAASTPAPGAAPAAGDQLAADVPLASQSVASESASSAPPSAPPSPPAPPEITLSAANAIPDHPAAAPEQSQPDTNVTLKVTSRLVDVGVIVYDKKGHPIKDLSQGDFEIYDNGRKQEIRFFSQYSAASPPTPKAPDASASPTYSNRTPDTLAVPAASAEDSTTTILLIDENHLAWADLNNARQQVLKFLSSAESSEKIGLYSMTERGFKVLREVTTNHSAIAERLKSWMPSARSVAEAQEEETRNRQQFNEVHNAADLNSVNGNRTEVPDAEQPVDPQLLTMGDNPGRAALIILGGVARHLSPVAGHKNLIWISSDNVFAEWQDQAVGIDKSPKPIDSFALHAQEAMNDAHVAVYPFDVSQLETAAITADVQHRNVELTQAANDAASLAPGSSGVGRNMTAGRVSAEMSQDLHPIQGPIREVAEATGGRTIRRSSDLAAEMAGIVAEGHTAYRLSFHPDTNADNQYHHITVKLSGKHGLSARYRTGYYYAKEPESMRERFQQAVWRPIDANEVAVTASVGAMNDGANIKINVAAGDLGLEQRLGRWMDRLDVFFIQRDDLGVHAQVEGQRMALMLKPDTYQDLLPSGIPYEHVVKLKPGTGSLRVLVVDENTGRMGSVTIPADALGGT